MAEKIHQWLLSFHLTQSPVFDEIIIITSFSLVAWIAWRIIINRLEKLSTKTSFDWDHSVIHGIKTPVSVLIWFWPGAASVGLFLDEYFDRSSISWIDTIKHLLVVCLAIWAVYRVIGKFERHVLVHSSRDPTTVQALAKLARLLVFIIGLLTILQALGLSLSGLLTFGGVGGLIVGLAAKDLLSNFFGGLMIYFDRPFKVGDWIRSPDREIEGSIERIGWRMTVIRTFDKRPLYVPNSVFSNIVVENPSRMTNRRIKETIGLRYDDATKVEKVLSDIHFMLKNHPDIDSNQTLIVSFERFGPSSLDCMLYTFTKTVNWVRYQEVKQDILLKVMEIIQNNGADVAFPTQTLKLETSEQFQPEP